MSEPSKAQKFLYTTLPGRCMLKVLTAPQVSRLGGRIVSSRPSRLAIRHFVKKNGIDMEECATTRFRSFNDFFTRELREGARTIPQEKELLISPCDAHLSIFPIDREAGFQIKNSVYTVAELLGGDERLAEQYLGGTCCIFRLTPREYHRYCYIDDGVKEGNRRINGVLHTVHPIAGSRYRVYATNSREFSVLETNCFGRVVQMEVGAMLVGKIRNYHESYAFRRGEEKGRFEFGGSTIVLLFEEGRVRFDKRLLEASARGFEVLVKMGEPIGRSDLGSSL
ncbi:MAG: phosphatidylserine decarboxylase [Clostridia bacterium]|nr:phosphatidylserine decarboxylase [Clostridia bacterium]MBQ6058704.1 phosphatidylserine decarboxylase [Clostridia bacterium]